MFTVDTKISKYPGCLQNKSFLLMISKPYSMWFTASGIKKSFNITFFLWRHIAVFPC